MRLIIACALYTVLMSIVSISLLGNGAKNAELLVQLSPVGVVLGAWTAARGLTTNQPYGGLVGVVQLAYWPMVAFVLAIVPDERYWHFMRHVLLGLLILAYLVSTAALFTIHLLKKRPAASSQVP